MPRAVFEGSASAFLFGHRVSSVDDINSDGCSDIIIDEIVYDERNGVQNCISRIFLGSREEISNTSTMGIRRSTTAKCYPRSNGAGDLNGDKIPDMANVLSTINGGLVQLYFSASPFDDVPDATLQAVDYVGDIVAGRDVNGDGKPDLAITEGRDSQSSVHLALANEGGGFAPFIKLVSDVDSKARVAFLPDVNGDGIDDVLVGSPDDINGNGAGHAALYFGSPGRTFDTQADAVWTETGAVRFGASVAMP